MSWNDNDKGPWGQKPFSEGSKKQQTEDDIERIIRESQNKIKDIFGGKLGNGDSGGKKGFSVNLIYFIAIIALLLWFSTGFYTVDTKEEAIVLRFGKHVATTKPGLRYHLPWPIERNIKLQVQQRNTLKVDSVQESLSNYGRRRAVRTDAHGNKEMLMLTGDENIVDVGIEVQWQIKEGEGYKFLFNVRNQEKTLRDSAESAMREVIGTTPLNSILAGEREEIQEKTRQLLQSILDEKYDAGISVEKVNMIEGVPPSNSIQVADVALNEQGKLETKYITTTVEDAFKDVQAAIIDKESTINAARAYANEVIPQARGQAEKLIQEAMGYKEKQIAKSEGDAERFLSVYKEYKIAKNVTRKRIYLETMEEILKNMDKMVLDVESGVLPYLPVNEIKRNKN